MSHAPFNAQDFRRALAQFPTGVTVMTTVDKHGKPIGMTASSFNSVSIEPALILWSIDKQALSLPAFAEGEYFIVNVLGRQQADLSNHFARRGADKFANLPYQAGLGGCPVLADTAACFECNRWASYDGGDHLIMVGEVVNYQYRDDIEPLVFARGSYAQASQLPEPAASEPPGGDFISDYLLYLLRASYQQFSAKLYPVLRQSCGVSPEQWRILSRLIAHPQISLAELSILVMQPVNALQVTADELASKGYLVFHDAQHVAVTASGSQMAQQLQQVAQQEEAALLNRLDTRAASDLKNHLQQLLQQLDETMQRA